MVRDSDRIRAGLVRAVVGCAAAVLILGSAGCAAAAPAPTVTVTVTAAAPTPTTASPTPIPTVTEALPQSTATVFAPAPEATVVFTPNPVPEIPEIAFAYDNGAVPGATGTATTNDAGEIVAYTVVAGDTFFDIAQRFGIPVQQLLRMNPKVAGAGTAVYIGSVIDLDASGLE